MFINREREKLLNAAAFFIQNTRHCHTLKLFKLLYFLDFEHFRQTGRSVTGLNYKAWAQGPVPSELWNEITHNPGRDLENKIAIDVVRDDLTDAVLRRDLKLRSAFDPRFFSKRETKIMDRLAELFRDVNSEDMSRISHGRKLPWGQVYRGGKGSGDEIPYDLAVKCPSPMEDMTGIDEAEIKARKELFAEIDRHT